MPYHEAHMTVVGLWQLEDVRDGTVHDLVVVGLTVQAKEGGIDLDVVTTSVQDAIQPKS